MAANNKKTIAVLGATGAQGGALVNAILKEGTFGVRAITRNPESDKAKALIERGAEVVRGDVDDAATLVKAFDGVYGLYVVTNFWAHLNADKERQQLLNIVDAAKTVATLKHVIVSTLEDTRKVVKGDDFDLINGYVVPHFDAKGEMNEKFTEAGIPTTFLYTAFYYQNFLYFSPPQPNGDGTFNITMPMSDAQLSMVDVNDIGRAALALLKDPSTIGESRGVAGALLPLAEIAAILSKVTGKTITYNAVDTKTFASFGFPGADDVANMYKYFVDYADEFNKLRSIEGSAYVEGALKPFEEWATENKDELLSKLA